MLSKRDTQEVRWILQFQWFTIALLGLIFWIMFGRMSAFHGMCGGLISAVPTDLFACILFYHQGAHKIKRIVSHFYLGEALKMGLTAVLFLVFMRWIQPLWWAFFIGFVLVQMSFFIAPCVYKR